MENDLSEPVSKLQEALRQPEFLTETEKREIVQELQTLTREVERIENSYKAGALESWIEPQGDEGRSWEEEMKFAIAHRNEGYIPRLTYPALEQGYIDPEQTETQLDIPGGLKEIDDLLEKSPELFPKTSDIARSLLEKKRKEFLFLQAIKNRDHNGAKEYMPFGETSKELVEYAENAYQQDLKPKPKKNETARRLSLQTFNAHDVKEYFEYALETIGASGWKVVIPPGAKHAISVSPESRTITIPGKINLDGLKLLSLIAHEIGAHAGITQKAIENGFGATSLGSETSVLQEGLAKLAERDVEQMILGYSNLPYPYYVLAISETTENGGDFWKTYDYLLELRTRELQSQGKSEDHIRKNVKIVPLKILRRIFRGAVDLQEGKYVYTKDKAYLEGEMAVEKIKELGLLGYMLAGKYDIPTGIYFLKTGITPKDAVRLTIDVAQRIWGNTGDRDFLSNVNWYRENYNPPYWREMGISDQEYIKAWLTNTPIKK